MNYKLHFDLTIKNILKEFELDLNFQLSLSYPDNPFTLKIPNFRKKVLLKETTLKFYLSSDPIMK